MAAKSSMPLDVLSSAAAGSLEKLAAVDAVRDWVVPRTDTSPLVFRIDPLVRSMTMLALTPGFLDRRDSFSSKRALFPYRLSRALVLSNISSLVFCVRERSRRTLATSAIVKRSWLAW